MLSCILQLIGERLFMGHGGSMSGIWKDGRSESEGVRVSAASDSETEGQIPPSRPWRYLFCFYLFKIL